MVLLAPTSLHTAAVEHRISRGKGSMLGMSSLAQQLEKATETVTRTYSTVAAATENTATTSFSKLAAQHCSPQIRSCLRLRVAAAQPGRDNSLRAHTETRAQMPILRQVNSLGIQSSRNTMNSGIDRFDGQRAFLRHAEREVRDKIAILCPDGTYHRCPLGSITGFAPREATVTQRPLRIRGFSSPVMGLPLNKKTSQTTLQSGADGNGTSGRAACRTAGERACVAPGTPAVDAQRTLVRWLGASAPNGNRLHVGAGTDGNGTPGRSACPTAGEHAHVAPGSPAADDQRSFVRRLGTSAANGNCIHSRDSTIGAYEGRVKDASRGHDT